MVDFTTNSGWGVDNSFCYSSRKKSKFCRNYVLVNTNELLPQRKRKGKTPISKLNDKKVIKSSHCKKDKIYQFQEKEVGQSHALLNLTAHRIREFRKNAPCFSSHIGKVTATQTVRFLICVTILSYLKMKSNLCSTFLFVVLVFHFLFGHCLSQISFTIQYTIQ